MPVAFRTVNERFFRIYSGNGFYVNLRQLTQPEIPYMEPRSETDIQTDGGRMTDFAGTFITDETTPFRPIEVSFQVYTMADRREMMKAFGNFERWPTWDIGGDTWTPVTIGNLGTRKDSRGNNVACVPPKDAVQLSYLVNLAWAELDPPDAQVVGPIYGEARGLVVTDVRGVVEGQLSSFNITGMLYGTINPRLTAWPAGTESVPAS